MPATNLQMNNIVFEENTRKLCRLRYDMVDASTLACAGLKEILKALPVENQSIRLVTPVLCGTDECGEHKNVVAAYIGEDRLMAYMAYQRSEPLEDQSVEVITDVCIDILEQIKFNTHVQKIT